MKATALGALTIAFVVGCGGAAPAPKSGAGAPGDASGVGDGAGDRRDVAAAEVPAGDALPDAAAGTDGGVTDGDAPDAGGDGAGAADVRDAGGDASPDGSAAPDGVSGDGGGETSALRDPLCGEEGFCWQYPRPQGNKLRGVWAGARDDVWAVGDLGTVIHYDGKRWRGVEVPMPELPNRRLDLYTVWGSGPNDVWIGGDHALLLHWNGAAWATVPHSGFPSDIMFAIQGTGPTDVWIAASSANVMHWDGTRLDGGGGTGPGAQLHARSVWAMSRGEAFVSTFEGMAARLTYKAADNTVSYVSEVQLAPVGTLLDETWGASPGDGWVGGAGDVLYHRVVGLNGTVFEKIDPGTSGDLHGIWGTAVNDVWAVGAEGAIVHWNGTRWAAAASPTSLGLEDVWGTAADDIWAVGDGGAIVHWNGQGWTRDGQPTDVTLNGVWAVSAQEVWAVGEKGTILHSLDGETFASVASPTTENLRRVWAASGSSVWMVGDHGAIVQWDGGKLVSWPALGNGLVSIWGTAADDFWVTGTYLYHFDGAAFQQLPLFETNKYVGRLWTGEKDRVFVTGGPDLVYDFRPSTGALAKMTVSRATLIWGTSAQDLWTSGSNGQGWHYDGTKWTFGFSRQLNDLWGSGPGDVWGVGDYGILDHHGPGEGNWTQLGQSVPISNNRYYGVHGASAKDVWVVGDKGTILRRQR